MKPVAALKIERALICSMEELKVESRKSKVRCHCRETGCFLQRQDRRPGLRLDFLSTPPRGDNANRDESPAVDYARHRGTFSALEEAEGDGVRRRGAAAVRGG